MTKKKARDQITILVLGDDGVGKSSLISTFVSRHFSERVPGVMTRVRLPANTNMSNLDAVNDPAAAASSEYQKNVNVFPYVTSIVDTQSNIALAAEEHEHERDANDSGYDIESNVSSAAARLGSVDALVLVYDLDRPQTFQRLESHWLPWIERTFSPPPATTETPNSISGPDIIDYNMIPPVIIAGNKLDLTLASTPPAQEEARVNRQQIVALLQRFKFVRHCIKTSAKTLLNVNDIFGKAQQVVMYPIWPLYDLTAGTITEIGKKAFTRIFRMFDIDRDNLLSDNELCSFQSTFFKHPILDKHIAGWKKVLSKSRPENADEYIIDDKFTVTGFLAMMEMFMLKDFWQVPWTILRHFGYDDDLKLEMPEWVMDNSEWKLSVEAHNFLTLLFQQFDSNKDGELSEEDMKDIFSIMPAPCLPPWHPSRSHEMFHDSFSSPSLEWYNAVFPSPPSSVNDSSSNVEDEDAGVTILSSQEASSEMPEKTIESEASSPTLNTFSSSPPTNIIHPPLLLIDWTTYWLMVSSISPSKTKMDLYRLGHDERCFAKESSNSAQAIRVKVFGKNQCGKTSFLNTLVGINKNPIDTESTEYAQTRCTHIHIPRARLAAHIDGKNPQNDFEEKIVVHIIFTEVPESAINDENEEPAKSCDLAIFLFDCEDEDSYKYIERLESIYFNDDTARVYFGNNKDNKDELKETNVIEESDSEEKSLPQAQSVVEQAQVHCEGLDLQAPTLISSARVDDREKKKTLEYIALCALGDLRSRPFAERKRYEAMKRKKIIWLSALGTFGIISGCAVAGYLWPWSRSNDSGSSKVSSWIRSCFRSLFGTRGDGCSSKDRINNTPQISSAGA